jgi:DNA-binding response OmpR family regulator
MDDEEIVLRLLDRILSKTDMRQPLPKMGLKQSSYTLQPKNPGAPFDAVILDLIMPDEMGGERR